MGVVEALAALAGLALVLITATDAVSTLVTTRRRPGRRLGAVWWGLRSFVTGVDGYLDAVYFAGVGFFTVGFGDLVPTADLPAGGGREHVVANPRS